MKHQLTLNEINYVFTTHEDARIAAAMLRSYGGPHLFIDQHVPPLNGYQPERVECEVLRKLMAHEELVMAIKFIRSRSGAGLVESKTWIVENFK